MTNRIATNTSVAISLADGDRLYVPGDVTVAVANAAAVISDNVDGNGHEVVVDGAVVSGSGNAILLQDDGAYVGDNRLIIGETGVVRTLSMPGNSAIYMLGSNSFLENHGQVSGQWGAYLQRWDAGVAINDGVLSGVQQAGLHLVDSSAVSVINSGRILSGGDAVTSSLGDFTRLFNTGEIIGGETGAGIRVASATDGSLIVNRGLIAGGDAAINLDVGDDVVRNRGDLDGDVRLGDGADVFAGSRDSTLDGRVEGGLGEDRLRGGGDDEILFGGGGNDFLNGGLGDDDLRGNAGADVFMVRRHGGDDVIRDLGHGKDQVDLSAFDLGWKQLKNTVLHETGQGVVVDLDRHGGGEVLLAGVELSDLARGDFIL